MTLESARLGGRALGSGRNVSDAPGASLEVAFARRAGLISRGSACSYSPKGDLPEAAGLHLPLAARVGDYQEGDCDAVLPACDSVWTLLHRDEHMKVCVAAYGTLVGICRLRRGFLFPEGNVWIGRVWRRSLLAGLLAEVLYYPIRR